MVLNFDSIISKYGKPRGVIHIGAHLMEERPSYLAHGLDNTIWVEANTNIFHEILPHKGTNERIFNFAICDVSDKMIEFYITNNNQSSSILKLDKHKLHHPHIHETGSIKVLSKRMDDLIAQNNIDIDEYNLVVLDIQGAELMAMKGFGDLLSKIDYIYSEVNVATLYENCAIMSEIDEYLLKFGFLRAETNINSFEWGDAFYVKNEMILNSHTL